MEGERLQSVMEWIAHLCYDHLAYTRGFARDLAVDSGLCRGVLLTAVFSMQSASTKTADTKGGGFECSDVRHLSDQEP